MIDHEEVLFELRRTMDDLGHSGPITDRRTVEHQLVLATNQVDVGDRGVDLPAPSRRAFPPVQTPSPDGMERR